MYIAQGVHPLCAESLSPLLLLAPSFPNASPARSVSRGCRGQLAAVAVRRAVTGGGGDGGGGGGAAVAAVVGNAIVPLSLASPAAPPPSSLPSSLSTSLSSPVPQ